MLPNVIKKQELFKQSYVQKWLVSTSFVHSNNHQSIIPSPETSPLSILASSTTLLLESSNSLKSHRKRCILCPSDSHALIDCSKSPFTKIQLINKMNLCIRCLSPKHQLNECPMTDLKCSICAMSHLDYIYHKPTAVKLGKCDDNDLKEQKQVENEVAGSNLFCKPEHLSSYENNNPFLNHCDDQTVFDEQATKNLLNLNQPLRTQTKSSTCEQKYNNGITNLLDFLGLNNDDHSFIMTKEKQLNGGGGDADCEIDDYSNTNSTMLINFDD